jgi:hypothetical protein
MLAALMPDEPEVLGLLALMLLHDSRRDARLDDDGRLVLLDDQDRSRWDAGEIAEGRGLLERALRRRQPGAYQLQAAIAACHTGDRSDWPQIVVLYGELLRFQPSPVVELNRAVAVVRHSRDRLDLQQRPRHGERRDFDERARRPCLAEELLTHRVDCGAVADIEQEERDLDDVLEPAAGRLQHQPHVPEDLPRLPGRILADKLPLLVEGHDAGEEDQSARLNGVGVVADRLGHPLDAELFAMVAHEKCPFSASKPPWKTSFANKPSQ